MRAQKRKRQYVVTLNGLFAHLTSKTEFEVVLIAKGRKEQNVMSANKSSTSVYHSCFNLFARFQQLTLPK
jgi:hypothetical protein